MPVKEKIEIKVASETHPSNLAGSIVHAWNDGKEVVLYAIGPAAVNKAVRAVTIGNYQLVSQGVRLAIIPESVTKEMPNLKNRAQMVPWVVTKLRLWNMFDTFRFEEAADEKVPFPAA